MLDRLSVKIERRGVIDDEFGVIPINDETASRDDSVLGDLEGGRVPSSLVDDLQVDVARVALCVVELTTGKHGIFKDEVFIRDFNRRIFREGKSRILDVARSSRLRRALLISLMQSTRCHFE